jgi:predicted GNAT superfamily acetyltransferase
MARGETRRKSATGQVTIQDIAIRKCEALEEMQACFALHREVWSFSDAELVPIRLFVVAGKIGGQVIGAFDGPTLIGFAMALPGMRNGHAYLHSQMLAVRQQFRNSGLGRRLKLSQRDDAIARGFELMEWSFDPLEIKNAYLNIEKLGAIARRYNVNQYGTTTSPLQGGLPTDRLIAEWWLKSRRVEAALSARSRPDFKAQCQISVPAEIYDWKGSTTTRDKAVAIQDKNRAELQEAFARGLAILGYERDSHGNGSFLLGVWDENWMY